MAGLVFCSDHPRVVTEAHQWSSQNQINLKKKIDQFGEQNSKRHNNALNHDRPHLQTAVVRGRLVLKERFVVCGGKMRS